MDSYSETLVTPSRIKDMIPLGQSVSLSDDFLISRLHEKPQYIHLKYPFRINCYVAAYCVEGSVTCSVNLSEYTLQAGMLLLMIPGSIVKITDSGSEDSDMRFTLICASSSLIQGIGLDISKFLVEAVEVLRDPCVKLSEYEASQLQKYVDLAIEVAQSNSQFAHESISGLISSVFYQFAGFLASSKQRQEQEQPQRTSRQSQMLEQFMKLATNHHVKEHFVGFYAQKMCVTPKYLSKIIKDASGYSVPDWLNELLILDAKNMLRNSNMSIKEVAAQLNFPNQSFFFRFFKNHTGQTPTQYRNE